MILLTIVIVLPLLSARNSTVLYPVDADQNQNTAQQPEGREGLMKEDRAGKDRNSRRQICKYRSPGNRETCNDITGEKIGNHRATDRKKQNGGQIALFLKRFEIQSNVPAY